MMLSAFAASLTLALGQTSDTVASDTVASDALAPEPPVRARLSFTASDADFGAPDAFTRLHAALEARSPELASGLRAEAMLSFFLNAVGSQGVGIQDNASLVRLRYRPTSWASREDLSLTVYPLSSTRLAMGYEQPVTWARQAFPSIESSGEPALELRLTRQRWGAYAAVKSARVSNPLELTVDRRLALFAGAGVDVTSAFRAELEATTVDRGVAPAPALLGEEQPVVARGVSGRVQWHQGAPVGPNVDLSLYAGDPTFFERFFEPELYPGGFAAEVSLEGSFVSQQLEAAEVARGEKDESASAAALVARLKWDFLRVHALAYYRTVTFIQVDVPGFPPYQALPEDSNPRSEVSGSVGADYHFQQWGLTPGLLLRATMPAEFIASLGGNLGLADRVAVLQGRNALSILPRGESRELVLTAKATVRWDLGSVAGLVGEVFYTRDPNRTRFEDDATGVGDFVRDDPTAVGGTLLLQARF
ncbi:hypothetical protein [Pyxidicoccus trucidator]|uniref:hypothetical protein n=1 Tax=Pyxidicoccus trucidator TaxID=2709662 RepID=UPI0013DD73E3|nr:hypothetical protein [Pyxidicoccus trucidator]